MARIEINLDEFDTKDVIEELVSRINNKYTKKQDLELKRKFVKENISDENSLPQIKTLVQEEKFELLLRSIDDISIEQLRMICPFKNRLLI